MVFKELKYNIISQFSVVIWKYNEALRTPNSEHAVIREEAGTVTLLTVEKNITTELSMTVQITITASSARSKCVCVCLTYNYCSLACQPLCHTRARAWKQEGLVKSMQLFLNKHRKEKYMKIYEHIIS